MFLREVKSGKCVVDTAEKFANVSLERNPMVHIKFIEKKDKRNIVQEKNNV